MPTIVHIIDPMFGTFVSAEILCIFKRNPLTVNLPVSGVILNLIKHPVRRHHLRHIFVVRRAVDKKTLPIDVLNKRLCGAQRFRCHVLVNVIARDHLWPILPLLYQELPEHASIMQSQDTLRHAESAITSYYLSRPVNWLGYIQQCCDSRGPRILTFPQRLKGWLSICQLWTILSLDKLDSHMMKWPSSPSAIK
jgi:hypothetical protein